jgi:antitoxin component of RelBE/YafQ-DinJ toxin-antitoxin module
MSNEAQRADRESIGPEVRLRVDDALRADIEAAREATGIRAVAEVVRFAVRQVARSGESGR